MEKLSSYKTLYLFKLLFFQLICLGFTVRYLINRYKDKYWNIIEINNNIINVDIKKQV